MLKKLKSGRVKLDAQTIAINTALSNFTNSVAASIVSLETAAANSLWPRLYWKMLLN